MTELERKELEVVSNKMDNLKDGKFENGKIPYINNLSLEERCQAFKDMADIHNFMKSIDYEYFTNEKEFIEIVMNPLNQKIKETTLTATYVIENDECYFKINHPEMIGTYLSTVFKKEQK